jgi:alcohol dehydrogenase class IV
MNQMLELRKFVVPEIIIGDGSSLLINRYIGHFAAKRPMIVTDKTVRRLPWFSDITEVIADLVETVIIFDDVTENPKDYEAMLGAELFLTHNCDLIIAVGGGSPIDCAKCISIVSTNGGHILDYEGVDEIALPGPPLICIPSTSGSAADVSQFAIITDSKTHAKKAIISKKIVPDLALIDPEPLKTMDKHLLAYTGMDALTHAIEAYVSNAQSPITDVHALEAVRLIHKVLEAAYYKTPALSDLYQLSLASTHAGFAFSNASLGAVHAMAHSLGALLNLPHGQCNSILLSYIIEANFYDAPDRYRQIAVAFQLPVLDASDDQVLDQLLLRIETMRQNLEVPDHITVESKTPELIKQLVSTTLRDPCIITNPKMFTESELEVLFEKIISES